ncbi:hypothetical protein C8J57DRAFT_1569901 [Mycena rebaudengoi]|nr:hypothetical protein C8J57DRAFT_1569901 [Mycena rebaudengoi]
MSIPSAFLGLLDEFLKYSRHEQSKWLIDIAHDICDPAAKCGSLLVWSEGAAQLWRPVAHTDALTASIYRYDVPLGVIFGLSKISQYSCWKIRHHRDRKREHRGRLCQAPRSSVLGDHLACFIHRTFSSSASPLIPNLSIYDEQFGISFNTAYEVGAEFVLPVTAATENCSAGDFFDDTWHDGWPPGPDAPRFFALADPRTTDLGRDDPSTIPEPYMAQLTQELPGWRRTDSNLGLLKDLTAAVII